MAEYIEKSVALLSIEHEDPAYKYAIERVPAADVVEVVRCKDCKHYVDENNGFAWCVCHTAFDKFYVQPNNYCSYGERKKTND